MINPDKECGKRLKERGKKLQKSKKVARKEKEAKRQDELPHWIEMTMVIAVAVTLATLIELLGEVGG